ncbi:MAG: biotin/lipoate A/B protein ligase family protein, partial [Halobacteriales archaeon]
MDLEDLDWRLIREETRPGAMQMALDEVAAETAAETGTATARVYRFKPTALTLGYAQDAGTVDWAACEAAGVDVVRRRTGGGGILHHTVGDVSYSLAVPADALPGARESYRLLLEPVVRTFERMHVDARPAGTERPGVHEPSCYLRGIDPDHDLVVGDDDGVRKVGGTAQHRGREAVLQHGSLVFSAFPERHLAAFADPGVDAAGFRERVAGLDEYSAEPRTGVVGLLEAML